MQKTGEWEHAVGIDTPRTHEDGLLGVLQQLAQRPEVIATSAPVSCEVGSASHTTTHCPSLYHLASLLERMPAKLLNLCDCCNQVEGENLDEAQALRRNSHRRSPDASCHPPFHALRRVCGLG